MAERSRREVRKPGQSRAASALAELAELRRSGKKRAENYELKEEQDIYDTFNEDEYADHIQKKRKEGFVVDDGVDGYGDEEEEAEWGEEEPAGGNAKGQRAVKSKNEKTTAKGLKRKAEETKNHQIGRMFAKHAGLAAGSGQLKTNDPKAGQESDALLDDILGDLGDSGPLQRPPEIKQLGGRAVPNPAVMAAITPKAKRPSNLSGLRGNPLLRHSAKSSQAGKRRATPALRTGMDDGVDLEGTGSLSGAFDGEDAEMGCGDPQPESAHDSEEDDGPSEPSELPSVKKERDLLPAEPSYGTPKPKPDAVRRLQEAEGITPKGAVAEIKEESRTPWKTPPPVFSEPPTPQTALPASGWETLCSETVDAGLEEHKEEAWVDDGSLPLSKDGTLPFYFLDAQEERSTPDIVYLFGKVPSEGSHLSCCLAVTGGLRTLYFIPRRGEIPDDDSMLADLEDEASKDPSKRPALLQHLHAVFSELKQEIHAVLSQHNVSLKRAIKPVKRNYAFELSSIPRGQQWVLKVKYPATDPQLAMGITGERFSAVLGVGQSGLEALMLKRRIMGPSWISVSKPKRVEASLQVSWCKLEVVITDKKGISKGSPEAGREPPPLVVAALSIKAAINPTTGTSEIATASVISLNRTRVDRGMTDAEWNNSHALRHFSVVRKLDGRPFPHGFEEAARCANTSALGRRNGGCMVSLQNSERSLLAFLLSKLHELDADVYTGHKISSFDLDVLLHRLQYHKVPMWSRLGRLKRVTFPNLGSGGHDGGASFGTMIALSGRLLCDMHIVAQEIIHTEVDYTLKSLSVSLLGERSDEVGSADVSERFETAEKLMKLLKCAEGDAWLSLGLSFRLNVLPLTRQLSGLTGSLWRRALQSQRAYRIEMLLLHEFHRGKFMLPDKLTAKDKEQKSAKAAKGKKDEVGEEEEVKKGKGPQYAGGLVLEPKKGLYDKFVLLLDFNSLYPSIIQEYNICFTTVEAAADGTPAAIPQSSSDLAPLPKVLQGLVRERRAVKDALKRERNSVKRAQMDIRQLALKLTANSMYGCLGFQNSRFYAQSLAELVTGQGREILQSTVNLVQGTIGAEVIYGDTDSIMIASQSTNLEEVKQLGAQVKKEVNKRYKLLEIELDGVYKCMLLLQKKKYAAIKLEFTSEGNIVEVKEQKGLDAVKRNFCPLAKDISNFALDQILSGRPKEDVVEAVHAKLQEVKEKMDRGLVDLKKFIITNKLGKRPEDYKDPKPPQVQVALRRAKQHKRDGVAQGDMVPYVICVELGEDGQIADSKKPYHEDEILGNPRLAVDAQYYLSSQVHPVVARLCEPIEGTDAGRLADCLGLDPKTVQKHAAGSNEDMREEALMASAASQDDDAIYQNCEPLMLASSGGETWEFQGIEGVLKGTVDAETVLVPPNKIGEASALSAAQLANQVQLRMHEQVSNYYNSCLRSDDEMNPFETRNPCLRVQGDSKPGTVPGDPSVAGQMRQVVSERDLYRQLTHYLRLVDAERLLSRIADAEKRKEAAQRLKPIRSALDAAAAAVVRIQSRSAHKWIDLAHLCGLGQMAA